MKRICVLIIMFSALLMGVLPVQAKVTPEEATRLGKDLTPFGSEKAGNAEGTIPTWTGGLTPDKAPSQWKAPNGHRPDPYANEKPLFSIDTGNVDKHSGQLTEGLKALFKAYPETFKMHVYPSHRSHALPQWINANTAKNAVTVELLDDGNRISENYHAGTLFPIPQNGVEVIWNHLTRYKGVYGFAIIAVNDVLPNGKYSLEKRSDQHMLMHFYKEDGIKERLINFTFIDISPARLAGNGTLVLEPINAYKKPRQAWLYGAGERRVRRAPTLNFDTPDSPITVYDQYDQFSGSPELYDWKLLGKKEMYIPYNNYRAGMPDVSYDELLTPLHPNPKYLRYERHRVWVVEATLKDTARHIYPRRVYYVDEDSWAIAASDIYDRNGKLWRTTFAYLKTFYDVPMTFYCFQIYMDLKNGIYSAVELTNESKVSWDFSQPMPAESYFTPQALRRRGRR